MESSDVIDLKSIQQSVQMLNNVTRSTIYTTTNLSPYQNIYQSGSELRIVIQKSPEHSIEFDKAGCLLSYRPLIKYSANDSAFASIAQNTLRNITIIDPDHCLLLSSITIGSAQLLSQTGMISGLTTRAQFMSYYNSLKKPKNKLKANDDYMSGVNFPVECGRSGFLSNAVFPFTNTSFNPTTQQPVSGVFGYGQNYSYNNVARAIVDQQFIYNMQSNPVKSTDPSGWINSNWACANYMGSGTPIPTSASGYTNRLPIVATSSWNGIPQSQLSVTNVGPSFAQMCKMIGPSLNIYYKQNSRWANLRARFSTIIQTIYNDSFNSSTVNCTWAPNQDMSLQSIYASNSSGGSNNYLCGVNQPYLSQWQGVTTVQGPLGTGVANTSSQAVDLQQSSITNPPSASNAQWYAPEQFTQQIVDIADIALELKQIGTVMLNEQIVIFLNWAQPNQCLSAFLGPSAIIEGFPVPSTPANVSGTQITPTTVATQPSVGQTDQGAGPLAYKNWLQSCLIGQTTISYTDVYLQLTYTKPDRSIFPLYKQVKEQVRRFQSIKCQVDQIPSLNSTFTQRLNISGVNYISGVISFLISQQQMPLGQDYIGPQNTILDYQNSVYIPNTSQNDLRATVLDSVFVPYSNIQIQADGKIYPASSILPVANGTIPCYLRTQQQIEQIFHGKVFGLSENLDEFVQNRAIYAVQINSSLSPEMQAVDSQILLQINWDASRLMAQTRAMGLGNDNIANTFALKSYIITNQCFVGAGCYVRTV